MPYATRNKIQTAKIEEIFSKIGEVYEKTLISKSPDNSSIIWTDMVPKIIEIVSWKCIICFSKKGRSFIICSCLQIRSLNNICINNEKKRDFIVILIKKNKWSFLNTHWLIFFSPVSHFVILTTLYPDRTLSPIPIFNFLFYFLRLVLISGVLRD